MQIDGDTVHRPEAKDLFHGKNSVRSRFAELHSQPAFDMADQSVAAHRLACFRAADLQHVAARGGMPEIVIEADNAVNLCL